MVTWKKKKKPYSLFSRYRIHYIKYIFFIHQIIWVAFIIILYTYCVTRQVGIKSPPALLLCLLASPVILFHEHLWYFVTCITNIRFFLWISHLRDANCPSLYPIVFNNSKFNTDNRTTALMLCPARLKHLIIISVFEALCFSDLHTIQSHFIL